MKLFDALAYLLNSKNQEFLQNKEKLHSALKDLCIDGRNERDESALFCKLNDAVSFFEKLIPYEKSGENQLIGEYNKVKGLVSKPLFTKLVVALGSLAQSGKAQANSPSLLDDELLATDKNEQKPARKTPKKKGGAPTQNKPTQNNNNKQNNQTDQDSITASDGWLFVIAGGVICGLLALITSWVASWFVPEVGWSVWQWIVGIFGGIFSFVVLVSIAMTSQSKTKALAVLCLFLIVATNCALKIAVGEPYSVVYFWFCLANGFSSFITLGFTLDEKDGINDFWGWMAVVLLGVSLLLFASALGNCFGCVGFLGCSA